MDILFYENDENVHLIICREVANHVAHATRDIKPMEVVLHDQPFGLSPIQDSNPVCLQCFRFLDPSSCFICSCGFPMCNIQCSQGPLHQPECQVYRAAEVQMTNHSEYQLIMPIRILTQLESNPLAKSLYSARGLLDHKAERQANVEDWNQTFQQVVIPLREKLKKQDWSEDLILNCIGIIRTNGCTSQTTAGLHDDSTLDSEMAMARSIHLSMSTLNHSCIPNCSTIFNPDHSLTIRAIRPILKGEELTLSYSPMFAGRLERQRMFRKNWFFECSCLRCMDITDLGTHFDTHLCSSCASNVLPVTLHEESAWKCKNCGLTSSPKEIQDLESLLQGEITRADLENPVQYYETFLSNNVHKLNAGHHIMMQSKCKLLAAIDQPSELKQIKRKFDLAEDLLNLFNIILPGKNALKCSYYQKI